MNGNNPYAGATGVVEAGRPSAVDVDVSADEVRSIRAAVAGIATRTQSYLPEGYAVGSEVSRDANGIRATVAVRPPAGHAVSAGFTPNVEDPDAGLAEADRDEVARGLAASAALQVMNAVGDGVTPMAR